MKRCNIALLVLASQLGSLLAGVVPGRWEKVDALPHGYPVVVHLKSGDRYEGRLVGSDNTAIVLGRAAADELKLPKSEIQKIKSRERSHDRVTDGLWKGLATGAAVGAPFLIWGLTYKGGESDDARAIGVSITFLSLGIGGGVGVGVDAMHKSQSLLYRAARR